ncbi:type II secretion system secretin GspD [Pseudoxanthomonas sp. CAU 1598]|uniref:Type II secretion system secretin GspD n=1 Tax=Pseudomarimonas arenosa TaxID=2774145 RepID=A0AAW3ZLN6_9GAMM|nr:type II secretion system secretin GspD [Pseudomarimonas arenosa]
MKLHTTLMLAAIVALSGCATTRQDPGVGLAMEGRSIFADPVGGQGPVREQEAELLGSNDAGQPASDIPTEHSGSGTFINESASSKVPPAAGAVGEVTFNFEGESLHAVIKTILGEILQQNYVIAPGVSGQVTFSTAKPLRGDQALSILEMLLRWNNATLVWQDGRYTILPIGQALPGNLTPRTGPVNTARGYEVRAVPLKFISAMEMEKVLKPYAKPEAVISVDPARNLIVLAGTQAELENYLQTVDVFDVDWLAGMSVGMFSLQQAEASAVVGELEKIFGEGSNTPLAGMFRFMPLEGINGVMVITPQPKYLKTVEEWLERFDLGSGEAGQRLYVYDVKNVKAADLAQVLGDVFGGSGSSGSRGSGSVAPGLEPVRISSMTGNRGSDRSGNKSAGGGDGGAGGSGGGAGGAGGAGGGNVSVSGDGDVRFSAVEEGNSLIVRATAAQWESIRRVIERLDVVPLQVAIEAQIISVQLNDTLNYGVKYYFENAVAGGLGEAAGQLSRNRNIWGDTQGAVAFEGNNASSIGWSFVGPNAGAIVSLLDSVSNVRVLSAPSLVVLNNKAASINSGASIPINSSSIDFGNGNNNTVNSTQYLQTGITLSVTPRVNPGGLVFLEIEQEDSTPGDVGAGGNPQISQNTISTEIAVQSGQTVLLGGLIKQTDSKGSSGVPGLHKIPVIGGLFGKKNDSSVRQELIVLITPKVITNGDQAKEITDQYKSQFRALQPITAGAAAVRGD